MLEASSTGPGIELRLLVLARLLLVFGARWVPPGSTHYSIALPRQG